MSFRHGLSQLQTLELRSETCFELMSDVEALHVASKSAIPLDNLVNVRLFIEYHTHSPIFVSHRCRKYPYLIFEVVSTENCFA